MAILVERLAASDYLPKTDLLYIDTLGLHELYAKLAFRANLILVGPKGVGKSLSVASFCGKHKVPVITFDCSEDIRRSQLIGMFTIRGNETPFILGPVTTALEVANETGRCVLIFEELNTLSPQSQKILNPLTDWRCSIEVPEAKQVFQLRPGAQLWVVATMNSSTYQGVYALNEDLKSRFRMLPIDYPPIAEERKILETLLSEHKTKVASTMLTQVLTLAKESRQGAIDYPLSTRDLVQLLEDIDNVGLATALWILSGKFEGSDRTTILKRMAATFGIAERLIQERHPKV